MRIQIRFGVFETNSSSVHSVTVLSDEEYRAYRRGDLYLDNSANLYTKEDVNEYLETNKKDAIKRWKDSGLESYIHRYHSNLDEYVRACRKEAMYLFNDSEWEIEHRAREINGQKVHAISIYSYDG